VGYFIVSFLVEHDVPLMHDVLALYKPYSIWHQEYLLLRQVLHHLVQRDHVLPNFLAVDAHEELSFGLL
jgi:hypothetical protein